MWKLLYPAKLTVHTILLSWPNPKHRLIIHISGLIVVIGGTMEYKYYHFILNWSFTIHLVLRITPSRLTIVQDKGNCLASSDKKPFPEQPLNYENIGNRWHH